MFSISGHILNNKRLITGINLYENLVFFKYNEKLLKCEGEQYCDCKRKNNCNSIILLYYTKILSLFGCLVALPFLIYLRRNVFKY